jgi:hypothetical protein
MKINQKNKKKVMEVLKHIEKLEDGMVHDIVWEIMQEKSYEIFFSRYGGYLNFYSRKENDEWIKYREEIGEPLPEPVR